MRHAHGALGPVLAGRAWSIRGDDHTFADTVEFDGPVGVVADRFEQIRLTLPLGEGFTGQMAVEPGIGGNDEVPTFLAALRYSAGWGAVNLTGSVGQYDDGAGQSATTHTLHVGAHVKATGATKVMATLNMTRGDGQIYGSAGATGTDASGDLKAYDSIGGMAGVSHGWSDSIRSGVFYGWVENDNPGMALEQDEANGARQCHLEPGATGRYRLRGHLRFARDQRGSNGRSHALPDRRQVRLLGAFPSG